MRPSSSPAASPRRPASRRAAYAPGLRFGLGARYVGTTEDWGGTRAEVPAFTTFDAMVGYTVGAWSMSVNVNNLTDKDTMICSSGFCTYGDGRRVTAQLGYRF